MKKIFCLIVALIAATLFAEVEMLERSAAEYLIKIDASHYEITENREFAFINFSDWSRGDLAGAPALPNKIIYFAVPPQGDISIEIVSQKKKTITLGKPVSPIPEIVKGKETCDYIYRIDPQKYREIQPESIRLHEKFYYRYYEVVPLKINPFLYEYSLNTLTVNEEMIFKVKITGNLEYENVIPDNFQDIYSHFFSNYEFSSKWMIKKTREIDSMPFSDSDFWFKIITDKAGMNKLDAEQLDILPDFIEPDSIRIFGNYRLKQKKHTKFIIEEIPVFISNEETFQQNGEIYFRNELKDDFNISKSRTFWLSFGGKYSAKPKRFSKPAISNTATVNSFSQKDPVDLSGIKRNADCLIIYPAEFYTQAQTFADLHSDELTFQLVDQQDIFDDYGETPQGVQDYIEQSFYLNQFPSYQYVMLLGSGTEDWEIAAQKNRIITYDLSDDNFVDFNSDSKPELIIGRIPAQNETDLDFYLERLNDYINNQNSGWWKNRVLLVADDENQGGDLEGLSIHSDFNHTQKVIDAYREINKGVLAEKLFAIEYDFDEYQNKPACTAEMMQRVNEGRLIWYFIGHGNPDQLGSEKYFKGTEHMNLFDNADHLPLFVAASCNVGQFDALSNDCLAERFLFLENGGAISCIAATRGSGPGPNTILFEDFLRKKVNDRLNLGKSLLTAKLNSDASLANSKKYNILGDPILAINPPEQIGEITDVPDSLQAQQTVYFTGNYGDEFDQDEIATIRIYDNEKFYHYENRQGEDFYSIDYSKNGISLFTGNILVEDNTFESGFVVPSDVDNGNSGRIINFLPTNSGDYITYYHPLKYSDVKIDVENNDVPSVHLWLDSRSFVAGDYVSTSPTLIAAISDSNGINSSGSPGHNMILLIDDSTEPIDVTSYFLYDINSFSSGELTYKIEDLTEGDHQIQLIVFDSFNAPAIAKTNFISKRSGKVAVEKMMPYPNPMSNGGYFTFTISEDADVKISIYTMSGKKIRTLEKENLPAGYNQIEWNGRDSEGDEIANNTYFYKLSATQFSNKKITEKIGKFIILK